MKKFLFLILITFVTGNIFAQEAKYFDVDNKEISKKYFEEKRSTNSVLDILEDKNNHHKLIDRDDKGNIKDIEALISKIKNVTKKTLSPNKPIVIIYYPGEDPCNSGGDTKSVSKRYKDLEHTTAKANFIYIYKDHKGLEKFGNDIMWIKDPEQTIEKLFFKHHYPCSSFVVISKNGITLVILASFQTNMCVML